MKPLKAIFDFLFGKTQTAKEVAFGPKRCAKKKVGKNPLVSCVVPAYNEERSIELCLKSLLASTYKKKEIVVIDDASTDKTNAIIKKLMKKHKEIRLIENKTNLGVGASRTKAVNATKGDYLVFVDAHSQHLDKEFIQKYLKEFIDSHTGVVKGGEVWKPGTFADKVLFHCGGVRPTREGFDLLNSPNTMYLKECFQSVGGMQVNWGSDLSMTCKVLEAGWKIRYAYHIKTLTDYSDIPKRNWELIRKNYLYGRGLSANYLKHFLTFLRRRVDLRIVGGGILNIAAIILVLIDFHFWPVLLVTVGVTRAHSMAMVLRFRSPAIYFFVAPFVLTVAEISYALGFIQGNIAVFLRSIGVLRKL